MMILVSYDVNTVSAGGEKRLRRIAKICKDFGQRVQFSVFELEVDNARWVDIRQRLYETIDPATDSLRFYHLGQNWQNRVEHIGAKPTLDLNGPLIF